MHTRLSSRHLATRAGIGCGSTRPVVSCRTSPEPPAKTNEPKTYFLMPAKEAKVAKKLVAGTDHDTQGCVISSGDLQNNESLLDDLRRGDAELVPLTFQQLFEAAQEYIQRLLEEQDLVVSVYLLGKDRKDQKSTGASKKILEGCTSLDQLKEILIKQLGPTKVDSERLQVWYSREELTASDFDNLNPLTRGQVFVDANIPAIVQQAKAWVLEEVPTK